MLRYALRAITVVVVSLLSLRFGEGFSRMVEEGSAAWMDGATGEAGQPYLLAIVFGPGKASIVGNGLLIFAPFAVGLFAAAALGCTVADCSQTVLAYDATSAGVLVWYALHVLRRRAEVRLWVAARSPFSRWVLFAATVCGTAMASFFVYIAHVDLIGLQASLVDTALGHSFLIASLFLLGCGMAARLGEGFR